MNSRPPTNSPARVVSLVPSDSYTLVRLGLGPRLVGRTDYCVEPEGAFDDVPSIGGTKNVDVERVLALAPDLVVANREENHRPQIEALQRAGLDVLLTMPCTVHDGLVAAEALADRFPEADRRPLDDARRALDRALRDDPGEPVPTFVPIWMDPLMTVHDATFIADALALAGGRNVFGDRRRRYPLSADLGRREPLPPQAVAERDDRYPRVTLEEVVERAPALVLLPDEPHAFTADDAAVFAGLDIPAAGRPGGIVHAEGRDLMWPGLRAVEGLDRLRALVRAAGMG